MESAEREFMKILVVADERFHGEALVEEIIAPLRRSDPMLVDTLAAFLEQAGSLEATARLLFVHVNTVRHRLRRIETLAGRSPTEPRDALAFRLALVWDRLDAGSP